MEVDWEKLQRKMDHHLVDCKNNNQVDIGIAQVAEFHSAFGIAHAAEPFMPELSPGDVQMLQHYADELADIAIHLKAQAAEANDLGRAALGALLVRLQLHVEETGELAEALAQRDIVGALDALSDIGYVNDGTHLVLGLGALKLAARKIVHDSNMSKLGDDGKPIIHPSGRVVKGPNYRPPDLKQLLK